MENLHNVAVSRRRLTTALNGITRHRLALITAPGGYGKTTLVRELIADLTGATFCWLSLDPADASLPIFSQQLARAVAKHLPHGGLFDVAPDRAPGDVAAVRHLGRAFASVVGQHSEERLIIVLDDMHHLTAGDQVMPFLEAFLHALPDSVHAIMTSRVRPALPLARLQATNQVIILTARELAFTRAEAEALLHERHGLKLPSTVGDLIMTHTEGWAPALLLIGNLLQEMPPTAWESYLERFPGGGALFAFLAEEVFAQQPDEIREFLLSTCILKELRPAVIERMLAMRDAGLLLQELDLRNLFVVATGPSSYRYHTLFQVFLWQLLVKHRGEEEERRLHMWAAQAYEMQGDLAEAMDHFLQAKAVGRAAELMAEQVDVALKSLRLDVVRAWLERVPADLLEADPNLVYVRAQLAGWLAQHEILPVLYQRCIELYEKANDHQGLARTLSWVTIRFWKLRHPYFYDAPPRWARHHNPDVRIYGSILQALAGSIRGDWGAVFTQLEQSLAQIPPATRAYFDCLETLAVVAFWRGDSRNSLKYGLPQAAGRTALGDFGWGVYNWINYCLLADPIGLELYHRQFLAMAVPPVMSRMHQAIGTLGQGILHLYHRRWEDALACFESLRPYFTDNRAAFRALGSEATFTAQSEMARIYARLNRPQEAREALQRNLELTAGYPEVTAFAYAQMADFLAAQGEQRAARAHLAKAIAAQPPGLDGFSAVDVAVSASRVALAEGDSEGARHWLGRALHIVRERGCAWWLLYQGGPEILPTLLVLAHDHRSGMDGHLVHDVIASLGEEAAHFLVPALAHTDPEIKGAAFALMEQTQQASTQSRVPLLKIYALGPLRVYRYDRSVESTDWNRTKVKLLLTILLLRKGKPATKEQVIDLFWPQATGEAARNSLRATMHGLRRTLEPDLAPGVPSRFLHSDRHCLWLGSLDEVWFDLWEFEDLLTRAKGAQRGGREEERTQLLQAACSLSRGTFLPEPIFADYFLDVRVRAEQSYLSAALQVAGRHLAKREYRLAVDYARRALAQDASVEEAYQILIQGYMALGERERAMQAYRTCVKQMRRLLGSEPSGETRALLE